MLGGFSTKRTARIERWDPMSAIPGFKEEKQSGKGGGGGSWGGDQVVTCEKTSIGVDNQSEMAGSLAGVREDKATGERG